MTKRKEKKPIVDLCDFIRDQDQKDMEFLRAFAEYLTKDKNKKPNMADWESNEDISQWLNKD